MAAHSKRNIFIILTTVLLGAIALICILVTRNDENVSDIRLYSGFSDKFGVVPFEMNDGDQEDRKICFFLPFAAETGAYRIDFPKNDRVYIDGVEYSSGDALLTYASGEIHRLEVVRHGKTVTGDVVFYYTDRVPAVSVDMEDGAFEKMSADAMHLDKKALTLMIVDSDTHLSTSEYCYIGGHGGFSGGDGIQHRL